MSKVTEGGLQTPEYTRMTEPPKPRVTMATEYITISVAEYHWLTKAAALLEVVINDPTYNHEAVAAVAATVEDMKRTAEAGAEE